MMGIYQETYKHSLDIKSWFMGTIHTFQCRANTGGLSLSQRERLKVNSLICNRREQSLLSTLISLRIHCTKACDQQNTLHNQTQDIPLNALAV